MKKVKVTPEMARQWLDCQVANRKPSIATVEQYVKAMEDGIWIADPSVPLRFNDEGKLADGQHRLLALERLGKPVDFYVSHNSSAVLDAIHNTKPRSLADRLLIRREVDVSNAKAIAALGTLLCDRIGFGRIGVNNGRMGYGRHKRRPDEIWAAFEWAGVDPFEVCTNAKTLYGHQPCLFRMISATLIGYILCQRPPNIEDFLAELLLDEHPSRRTSVVTVRRQMGNTSYSQTVRLSLCAQAFNNPNLKTIKVGNSAPDLDGGSFIGR